MDESANGITRRPLPSIQIRRRTQDEAIHSGNMPIGRTVGDFWQWAGSDLISNTFRGWLAEYIVACALDLDKGIRSCWGAYDLETKDGIRVEVKASGYLQSWAQYALSKPNFSVSEACGWDPLTNITAKDAVRASHVYVFCLHAHTDAVTVDPTDLRQWEFYVVPTAVINERLAKQKTIGLSGVRRLCPNPTAYEQLAAAIRDAAAIEIAMSAQAAPQDGSGAG